MDKIISTGLGIGYIKKGGGTVASVFCCLILWALQSGKIILSSVSMFIVAVLLIVIGKFVADKAEDYWGKDNYRVVIDEIAGMWITMLFVPLTLKTLLLGLLLFRLFDIFKPLYIRKAEALPAGYGVMADDVLAGIYSCVLLNISEYYHLI